MDFNTIDLETLTTENSSVEMGYDTRKKLKSMLIGLINEGQKLIKETEKKRPVPKPTVVVKNVRYVPKGLTINHKKIFQHEEIKPEINFLCGICKSRFKGLNLLSEHSKVCKSSNLKSTIKDDDNNMNLSVEGDPKIINPGAQFKFNCGICKTDFKTFDLLSQHSEGCKPMNMEVEHLFEDDYNDVNQSSDDEVQSLPIEINLKCEICNNNFESLDQLSKHSEGCKSMEVIEDDPVEISKFKCVVCKSNFQNIKSLFKHSESCKRKTVENPISSVNNQEQVSKPAHSIKLFKLKNGKFRCSICEKLFETMNIGMLHVTKHYPNFKFIKKGEKVINNKVVTIQHQIKQIIYKCSICFKNFTNYKHLTEHKLIHNPESTSESTKQLVESNESPMEITEEIKKDLLKSIKLRKKLQESTELKFTRYCKICDKKFYKSLKDFNNHVYTVHSTVEKFPCTVCEKITFTKIALDSHMLLGHTDLMATKLQCEKCDHAPFRKQQYLNNHMAKKHSNVTKLIKTNVCEICDKVFCDVSGKERHVASVHENQIFFVCEYCGKGFKSSVRELHYRTHTGERPFSCDQCDSKFRYSQDLLIHKRLHSGERPYECTICHERFIANTNLNKHLKSRHLVTTGISIY